MKFNELFIAKTRSIRMRTRFQFLGITLHLNRLSIANQLRVRLVNDQSNPYAFISLELPFGSPLLDIRVGVCPTYLVTPGDRCRQSR